MSLLAARQHASRLVAVSGSRPPVDVERIARDRGLRVLRGDLGGDVSGILITTPGKPPTIIVHKTHARTRQRFTIAHELGHYVLRHQAVAGDHVIVDRGNFISLRGPRAAAGVDIKEIEANRFAADLLMPEAMVRIAVGDREQVDDIDVMLLAKQFQVSEQAMTIRLTTFGLL